MSSPDEPLRPAERLALTALAREREGLSRADIASRTGLSKATMMTAARTLLARGLVEEMEPRDGLPGRPARRLRLRANGDIVVVALSHRGAIADVVSHTGATRIRQGLPVDRSSDLDHVVRELRAVAGDPRWSVVALALSVDAPVTPGVGVHQTSRARAGSKGGRYRRLPLAPWLLNDPQRLLGQALGIPVIVENDSNLAALGEYWRGASAGSRACVYVDLVNGIGSGIVINGELFRGGAGVAGELAHVSLGPDGPVCFCGSRGCLVASLSAGPQPEDQLSEFIGHAPSPKRVAALVAGDDPAAVRALTDYGRKLGTALAGFVSMFNPDVIVVDGRLGDAMGPVLGGVRESLRLWTQPLIFDALRVVSGELGTTALTVGGVGLARSAVAESLLSAR